MKYYLIAGEASGDLHASNLMAALKENDPKMIFIYGENDPWTAAGVTWLKEKKNIHVFIQPGGSHLARISTLPEKEKEEVMKLLNEWLR